jgi:hypothetical protein
MRCNVHIDMVSLSIGQFEIKCRLQHVSEVQLKCLETCSAYLGMSSETSADQEHARV